ncbi:MAG: hypothetical protein RLZZ297_1000 [Chloroflexota bacterium]|jgi:electron transfer flavoprotein beta subunit
MHIITCIKQVPRDNTVAIAADGRIDASGIEPILNLFDEYALEAALSINDSVGGEVTVVSLGTQDVIDQLRRSLAMGATDALLIESTAEHDIAAAAGIVHSAIAGLASADVVVCGRNATDDESAAFGPMLAQRLGWAHVTYVSKIINASATELELERTLENEREVVRVALPAVITVGKGEVEPRFPSLLRVRKYAKAEVPVVAAAAIANVATVVGRTPPSARSSGEILTGTVAQQVKTLVDRLVADQAL